LATREQPCFGWLDRPGPEVENLQNLSRRHVPEGELSQFLLLGRERDRLALEEETP
jgi:hypothetical protein